MTQPPAGEVAGEQASCGCCGRSLPRRRLAELGATPGVFICRRCAAWAILRGRAG